jgi:long-chain fatty acid transport protein
MLALATALGLASRAAHASPEDVFGFGPRSMAMGATGAASAEGFEAVWGNPALLSVSHRRSLSLGLFGAVFDLHARDDVPYPALHGSLLGATVPLPLGGALRDRVTVGLGFFTPFDVVVRGRILYPEKPQFPVADRTQSVAVQAGLGVYVGHGVRVGGGFAALAALSGSVLVATDASGRIGTVVEDTLVASYGPIAGVSYDVGRDYRVGLALRGELEGRFDVVITVRDLGQIVVPPLHISGMAQYDPTQLAAEVARVRGPWRGAIGLTWKRWSAYPGAPEATVRCPPGPDGEDCAALVPAPPGYSDTVVPRLGVERAFAPREGVTMLARAGYFFEPSPAPEQTREANVFDEARSALTIGYGLRLDAPLPPVALDAFAGLQVLHGRAHAKDAVVASDNAGAPRADTGGVILSAGTALEVSF